MLILNSFKSGCVTYLLSLRDFVGTIPHSQVSLLFVNDLCSCDISLGCVNTHFHKFVIVSASLLYMDSRELFLTCFLVVEVT